MNISRISRRFHLILALSIIFIRSCFSPRFQSPQNRLEVPLNLLETTHTKSDEEVCGVRGLRDPEAEPLDPAHARLYRIQCFKEKRVRKPLVFKKEYILEGGRSPSESTDDSIDKGTCLDDEMYEKRLIREQGKQMSVTSEEHETDMEDVRERLMIHHTGLKLRHGVVMLAVLKRPKLRNFKGQPDGFVYMGDEDFSTPISPHRPRTRKKFKKLSHPSRVDENGEIFSEIERDSLEKIRENARKSSYFGEEKDGQRHVWKAQEPFRIVGTCHYHVHPRRSGETNLFLDLIFTRRKYRGLGLAKKMLKLVFESRCVPKPLASPGQNLQGSSGPVRVYFTYAPNEDESEKRVSMRLNNLMISFAKTYNLTFYYFHMFENRWFKANTHHDWQKLSFLVKMSNASIEEELEDIQTDFLTCKTCSSQMYSHGQEDLYKPELSDEDTPDGMRKSQSGFFANPAEWQTAEDQARRDGIPAIYPPETIPFSPENMAKIDQLLDINSNVTGGYADELRKLARTGRFSQLPEDDSKFRISDAGWPEIDPD
ncbi:hypothetical protein AAMO2058_000165300 [Amorphochlora amoebiformis]